MGVQPAPSFPLVRSVNGETGAVTVSVSASSVVPGGGLWVPPASADARDEEFTSFSGWTLTGGTIGASAPDAFAGFSGSSSRTSTTYRPSWFVMQVDGGGVGSGVIYDKAKTLTSGEVMYSRPALIARRASGGTLDSFFTIGLYADSGGAPDGNNWVDIGYPNASGTIKFGARSQIGGVYAEHYSDSTATLFNSIYEYVAIQRTASGVTFWAAGANGAWVQLASVSLSFSIAWCRMLAYNVGSTAPNNIVGVDFIRFGSKLP